MRDTPTTATMRHEELGQMLRDHRRGVQDALFARLRDGRRERAHDGGDEMDVADAQNLGDMSYSLLQRQADLLSRIDEALARLEAGRFGWCAECGDAIPAVRLRALPFAVRCRSCEERREVGVAAPLDAGLPEPSPVAAALRRRASASRLPAMATRARSGRTRGRAAKRPAGSSPAAG